MALVCTLTAVGLLVALSRPSDLTIDVGAAGDTRYLGGFYLPENGAASLRWSGPWSQLMLHGLNGGPHILSLRTNGDPIARTDRTLTLERDGDRFATMTIAPAWRVYRVLLPERATSNGGLEAAPIRLLSATHRPGPDDGRDLGIPLDWVQASRPGDGRAPLADGVLLLRVAMLTWVVAVLFWGLDCGLRIGTRRIQRVISLALTSIAAIALILWAWRDPYTMAWALPALPWALGSATALLVGAQLYTIRLPPSALRLAPWIGAGALVCAQLVFSMQRAIGVGLALAPGGLCLLLIVARHRDHLAQPLPDLLSPISTQAQRTVPLLLGLIFLLALVLRLYRITDLPFGLWRDEARHGLIALEILGGYRPIYIAENRVNMPALGFYPFALAINLWGIHPWTMRIVTALAGALTVLPLYGLTWRLFGRRDIALLAAALLAVSSWHISISRFSFPTIFDPLLGLTGLWLLMVGLEPGIENREPAPRWEVPGSRLLVLGLAGGCIGLAVQTYHTGRVVPVVAGVLALLVLLRHRQRWRQWLGGMLVVGVSAVLVLWPLANYALNRPAAFNDRVNDVFLLSENTLYGRAPLAALDEALGLHLLMFNVYGDPNGRHHAPGRPLLDLMTGLGFLVGCAMLLRRWRDWRSLFLFAALGLSLLPSALAMNAPHAMRSIGAATFACIIAAIGWVELFQLVRNTEHGARNVEQRPRTENRELEIQYAAHRSSLIAHRSSLIVVVMLAFGLNVWTYFIFMANERAVWSEFYPIETQIGAYVRDVGNAHDAEALSRLYIPAPIARDVVFEYLTYGLPPAQTFGRSGFSRPPTPDALFVIPAAGETGAQDLTIIAPYLNTTSTPLLRGPNFPGEATPSFVVYEAR